jgi:hypothetical protein
MAESVNHEEWTDEEWLRVLREFLPGTRVRICEEAVGKWREEDDTSTSP